MGFMDYVRSKMRSFLQIEPAQGKQVTIRETLDREGVAIRNRIWYRGDGSELSQLYREIAEMEELRRFWAARSTPGMEMRKIHTGLPGVIVDTLAGITVTNLNGIQFENQAAGELWESIARENRFEELLQRAVTETLIAGDGAFKLSLDPAISENPLLEFWPGERVDYTLRRGRVTEVIFRTATSTRDRRPAELREIYGLGYVRYELTVNGEAAPLESAELDGLQNVEFDGGYMMAVPVRFFPSERWEGRGRSIFDGKTDSFDALDEAWSQWMDALRAGRAKTYIPENLIPRDPNTGALRRPNPFDDRFIRTEADMAQNARNMIQTEQPDIPHDSYAATYSAALDQCLQGLISPSTLGMDIQKRDNAEAQREKEKVTLYTRSKIIEPLAEALKKLAEITLRAYYDSRGAAVPEDIDADVSFGDYAAPSFEAAVECVGKAVTSGIMSTEAALDELYGDTKDDEWKAEEAKRIRAERGVLSMDEPAVNEDGFRF